MAKNTFILSDQTKNQYGFVVLTAGINLDRFKQNPVMLYNHENDSEDVLPIGRWENIRVEGGKLMADPVFDGEDDFAVKIEKKVAGGFIKGASIWVDFNEEDVKLNVPGYEGVPVVVKSELMEGSIVPVPNNKNSIKLMAGGKALDEELATKLSAKQNNENEKMKNILVFAATLGLKLAAEASEEHVAEALKAKFAAVENENATLKAKLDELNGKLAAEQDAKIDSLIDGAVVSKKLAAEQKDYYKKLAKADFESTKAIIDSMVPHTSITEMLGAGGNGKNGETKNPFEGKGFKDLMKFNEGSDYLAKLRAGTAEQKAEYKKLWEAAYPGKQFNG